MTSTGTWKWWAGIAVVFATVGLPIVASLVQADNPNRFLLWVGYAFSCLAVASLVIAALASGRSQLIAEKVARAVRSWHLKRRIGRDGIVIAHWLRRHGRTILRQQLREAFSDLMIDSAFDAAFESLVLNETIKVTVTGDGELVRPSGPSSKDLVISSRDERRIKKHLTTLAANHPSERSGA